MNRLTRLLCVLVAAGLHAATSVAQDPVDPPLTIAIDKVPPRPAARVAGGSPRAALTLSSGASGAQATPAKFNVGVKNPGAPRGVWQATRLIARSDVLRHVETIRAIPGVRVLYVDAVLPFAAVEVAHSQALTDLSAQPFLDYLDPARGDLQPQGVGCDEALPDWQPVTLADGDVVPRIFPLNGVTAAWRKHAFGQGVVIGVVDTGLARDQQELGPAEFRLPLSSGRSVAYMGCTDQPCLDAMAASAFDQCNHGTRIAGAIAAPRNGKSVVGVAYKSGLQVAKAGDGVWCDDLFCAIDHLLAIRRVRDAGARIIQMAFGGATDSPPLADEISFQFHRTDKPEVLFIAAAGTKVCVPGEPVIFPARMPEVLAVTAVNLDGTLEPNSCTGPEVRLAVKLLDYETTGMTTGKIITLGATSGASAIAAGSAALMWSRQPRLSRAELVRRLTTRAGSSQINVPVLRADKAVGGVSTAHIVGW